MDLLVLGGTQFVGRHMVSEALRRGHTLTLFNRGSRPEVFPEVEQLRGDRRKDVSVLEGRSWDAVIDTSGYILREVEAATRVLKDRVGHYTFVSSISVYSDQSVPFQDESAPLAGIKDRYTEEVTGETYGALKAFCERAVEDAFPDRALILRPGLIVGPYDPTDRFTYWPARIAEGGEVLAPGEGAQPVQFIDARDLASWTLDLIERRQMGIFNAVSTPEALTFSDMLETCREVSGSDARFTWVDEGFLLEQGVTPWQELPLWVPGEDANFLRMRNSKALEQGLKIRPLEETVRDTLIWSRTRPKDTEHRAGMRREKEETLLAAWHRAGEA